MKGLDDFFKTLYRNFNDRKIDLVIDQMAEDVKWANGMDGGFVYGHNQVREYWTRQFALVSSRVSPMEIRNNGDKISIKVHQVVHDLDGKLIADQTVTHIFTLNNDEISHFEIGD